jgi:uncharacterized protein (DUF433 family)
MSTSTVIQNHIESTPGVRGGKPRISGTRITVSDVAIWHERCGRSPEEIVADYPHLTLGDVHAALAYYFDHRDEIRAEIEDSRSFAEELRQPSKVGEKPVRCPTLITDEAT